MDYSGMIKITDKARDEILRMSSDKARFEIFNLVFKVYWRICEGEVNKRRYKPYCYTRYLNTTWCGILLQMLYPILLQMPPTTPIL
jgi:hypothetical protein